MARQLDVDTIVKIVGDKVREIFQAEGVTILLYDADAGMIQEAYAYDRGDVTARPPFPLGQGMTSTIIQSRRPLVSAAMRKAPSAAPSSSLRWNRMKSSRSPTWACRSSWASG